MATYNQGDGLQFRAQLDVPATTSVFQQQLEEIASKLSVKVTAQFDQSSLDILKNIANNIETINKLSGTTNQQFADTVKIFKELEDGSKAIITRTFPNGQGGEFFEKIKQQASGAKASIEELEAGYENFYENLQATGLKIDKVISSLDKNGNFKGFTATLSDGLNTITQYGNKLGEFTTSRESENFSKIESAVSKANDALQMYVDKLSAIDKQGAVSQSSIQAIRDQIASLSAVVNEEGATSVPTSALSSLGDKLKLLEDEQKQSLQDWTRYAESLTVVDEGARKLIADLERLQTTSRFGVNLQPEIDKANGLIGTGNVNSLQQQQQQYALLVTDIKEATAMTQAQMQAEKELARVRSQNSGNIKTDEQLYAQAINQKIKLIETFNDLGVTSSREMFDQLKQMYTENSQYFSNNIDAQIKMLNKLNDAEIAANEGGSTSGSSHGSTPNRFRPLNKQITNTTGFGMTPLNMGITLAQIQLESTLINNIRDGFVTLQQGAAGLQQVFGDSIKNQSQLNDVTNQFVAVAQKYGASVDDVVTSAKLWGRQYKDVETALTLTNNATLLSIVDNLNVADANKAVESSMNAMGESVTNAGQAYNDSIKLVDSWSAVSHAASVSASDLTQGFERSAAAAHNAGITVDELNSLVAAGVRNTGRSGSVIGGYSLAA